MQSFVKKPWHVNGIQLKDASGKIIGLIYDWRDAEKIVSAININWEEQFNEAAEEIDELNTKLKMLYVK